MGYQNNITNIFLKMNPTPFLSIIVPVYNEEEMLEAFHKRLIKTLEKNKYKFEVLYINDGSSDKSESILSSIEEKDPKHVYVLNFDQNYGQHIAAGFDHMRGDVAINLDADLQNPPEEIPKLVEQYLKGHDMVGSYRLRRKDHKWRDYGSKFANFIRKQITTLDMKDQGCMFRAYSKELTKKICQGNERALFVPALGWKYAKNPIEIGLVHDERAFGKSKYKIYDLLRVSVDLATSMSLAPIQLVTATGILTALFSFVIFVYMIARRFIYGPEVEGVFTLFALVFFMIGIAIFGIGVIGEYIGRIYHIVQGRPRYNLKNKNQPRIKTSQ